MVKATNSGGEAQSIADIAVYEPTPDTMVEVVKTVVFEDVRKHETLVRYFVEVLHIFMYNNETFLYQIFVYVVVISRKVFVGSVCTS